MRALQARASTKEDDRDESLLEEADQLSTSLYDFIKAGWHVLEPGTPFVDNWHIGAIAEHLEAITNGELRQLIINIPPRHMKSLFVCVFWPTWQWTRKPETRFLTASYASTLSVRDARKSRLLMNSDWYQQRWGHVWQFSGDQNVKGRYENNRMGYRIATSFGGTATGDGGNIRIIDDPHKAADVHSDTVREGQLEWWKETWTTRQIDPKTDADVLMMQRLHDRDLSGFILSEIGGYEHLCLPVRYESDRKCVTSIGFEDPRKEDGELLNPNRFGEEEVQKLERQLGQYGTAGQLQQRPAPADGGLVKRAWFRFWQHPGMGLEPVPLKTNDGILLMPVEDLPAAFEQVVQSWDMTFKDTKASDFVSGGIIAAAGANRYLLDRWSDKADIVKTLEAVKSMTLKWPKAGAKYVEDKANGPAIISMLHSHIAGLIPVEPQGSKLARLHACIPQIQSGNVYLPHPTIAPWVWDFITQVCAFPNAAHDDDVDMLTQALIKIENTPQIFSFSYLGG